jgi:hypothetical protein
MKHQLVYLLSIIITFALFITCDDETKGPVFELGTNDYVSFLTKSQTFNINDNDTKVVIYAYHLNKTVVGTTVDIAVDCSLETKALFEVLSTQLHFVDENPVPIEITFDATKLEYNVDYSLTLTIPPDTEKYPLGSDSKTIAVKIRRALTFTSLGEGRFISELLEEEWEQEILSAVQKKMYRLPNLYRIGYPMDIQINEDETVTILPQSAWYNNMFGDVYVEGTGVIDENSIKMQIDHYIKMQINPNIPAINVSLGVFNEELILSKFDLKLK